MIRLNQKTVIYLNALGAAVIYGGWGVYANMDHGMGAGWMAGGVQALIAFTSTLTVTLLAHHIYDRMEQGVKGVVTGFAAAFVLMAFAPAAIHWLSGTPNIITTISPGLVLGSIYTLCYLTITERRHRQAVTANEDVTHTSTANVEV